MTWPTDRPGYPRDAWNGLPPNPERRGWHWLGFKGQHEQGREPWAWLWSDEDGAPGEFQWMTDDDGDPERMARQFTYLGPCYTQADLDAAVQAERDACLNIVKLRAEHMNNFAIAWASDAARNTASHIEAIETAIRARGPTSALDAALAQARAEGMEAAEAIAHSIYDKSATAGEEEYAQGAFDVFAAIRSAAAGEEGK